MSDDDAQARKARAERLRKEIEQLIEQGEQTADVPPPPAAAKDKSPRELIHKKMQEQAASRSARAKSRNQKPRG
jgi:hypothetical protein